MTTHDETNPVRMTPSTKQPHKQETRYNRGLTTQCIKMKTFSAFLVIVALTLTACGNDSDRHFNDGHDPMHDETHMSQTPMVHMEEGVQVVSIEAGANGYEPAQVELAAGIPARLLFTRTTASPCLAQVTAPDFGIDPVDLPLNETVAIEFTPGEPGTYSFACGMDMVHGTVIVRS